MAARRRRLTWPGFRGRIWNGVRVDTEQRERCKHMMGKTWDTLSAYHCNFDRARLAAKEHAHAMINWLAASAVVRKDERQIDVLM